MNAPPATAVTRLLHRVRKGDRDAVDALFRTVYDELHGLAERQRHRWNGNYTLNTTALLHEAYLKLIRQDQLDVDGRAHFFALAAQAMRHILSNYARDQRRLKRGGSRPDVPLDALRPDALAAPVTLTQQQADAFAHLDEALARLEAVSPRQSRVVECRFYGSMTVSETATALDISPATVKRDWTTAQAWLYREMKRLQA
jgi:RNA polymerase sigma factor (TIGR02999 family)